MKINLIKKQTDMSDIEKDLFLEEEKALIDAFELEELEKRYEMGWINSATVTGEVGTDFKGNNTLTVGVGVSI